MNALHVLALINAAIALIEKLPPLIMAMRQSSEMTAEQGLELDERIARLRDQAHWRVDG